MTRLISTHVCSTRSGNCRGAFFPTGTTTRMAERASTIEWADITSSRHLSESSSIPVTVTMPEMIVPARRPVLVDVGVDALAAAVDAGDRVRGQRVARRALADDLAVLQAQDVVHVFAHDREVVRDDQHRHLPLAVDLAEQIVEGLLVGEVDAGRGLVKE